MNGFFKSRFFVVLLTLLVLLSGVPSILIAMGQGSAVRDAIAAIAQPFEKGATYIGKSLRGFSEYFTAYDALKADNEALAARVAELEREIYDAKLLEKENEWMRTYLGAKRAHADYTFCDANLIGRESGRYITSFTLDRGTSSGIAVGMPVVTDDCILGRVTEVGLTFCRVSTLISYDTSIGVYVERSGEVGIVDGEFSLQKDGLCRLEYLSFDADVEVGDVVCSSGLGSVFPRGLTVGEVIEVTGDAYDHTKVAIVRPAADLTDVSKVMILTEYSIGTD